MLVNDLYESRQHTLAWTHEHEPTSQAEAIIRILESAVTKVLHPTHYDRGLWSGRIAALHENQHQCIGDDSELFDLALTISITRYVSDLHMAKVNPALFVNSLRLIVRSVKLPYSFEDQ